MKGIILKSIQGIGVHSGLPVQGYFLSVRYSFVTFLSLWMQPVVQFGERWLMICGSPKELTVYR
jgi:hypothetical protein